MLQKYIADHVWIAGRRCYQIGNSIYPGVTSILSGTKSEESQKAIADWRKKVGEWEARQITKAACERGTIIHHLIEERLQGNIINPPAGVEGFWNSIEPWLECVNDVQLIEGVVWHSSGFAGSVDCVARWNNELSIIDWKTSNKPKRPEWIDDYFQQTAAYRAAVNELYNIEINQSVVVIGLEDQPAQVFINDDENLSDHWLKFRLRIKEFDFPTLLAGIEDDDDW